jgi:hypothetical protein
VQGLQARVPAYSYSTVENQIDLRDACVLAIRVQPLTVDLFERRFSNWVKWCNRKGLHQGRTGSAEGNWRSPQIWHPPEPRPEVLNEPDALLFNSAYWQLGERVRQVIKILVFRPHLRPQWQAQKLGVHYLKLDEELAWAKTMMKNRVSMIE